MTWAVTLKKCKPSSDWPDWDLLIAAFPVQLRGGWSVLRAEASGTHSPQGMEGSGTGPMNISAYWLYIFIFRVLKRCTTTPFCRVWPAELKKTQNLRWTYPNFQVTGGQRSGSWAAIFEVRADYLDLSTNDRVGSFECLEFEKHFILGGRHWMSLSNYFNRSRVSVALSKILLIK